MHLSERGCWEPAAASAVASKLRSRLAVDLAQRVDGITVANRPAAAVGVTNWLWAPGVACGVLVGDFWGDVEVTS